MKNDVWDIDVRVIQRWRVCFDEEVTLEEARKRVNNHDFEDVIDTEDIDWKAIG